MPGGAVDVVVSDGFVDVVGCGVGWGVVAPDVVVSEVVVVATVVVVANGSMYPARHTPFAHFEPA